MKVLVIGTGAVGSFYGALLARQGMEVSVAARSDHDAVAAEGIHLDSPLGTMHFIPRRVSRSGAELTEKPDVVLLCVKVVDGVDRVALLKGAVGPNTAIVLLSNGIDVEREIAAAFPDNELISALAFICVTRTRPGHIWHQAYGRIVLGRHPEGNSRTAGTLTDAFAKSGVGAAATENIVTARWQKCVWNAPFNILSVLSGGLSTHAILATQEPMVRAIMDEVVATARAAGHPLPGDVVEKSLGSTHKMPPYKTSMLLDFEAGRPMETEAILGNAVRAARAAGVAVPHLETLYGLMKLVELHRTQLTSPAQNDRP